MAKPILDDELWQIIEPLLPSPKKRRKRHPSRKPIDNRSALCAILLALKTGLPWERLPQELGWRGSGMTAWRRLHAWQKKGVWQRIHEALLVQLQEADKIDWSRAVVDSSSVRAMRGGKTEPNPTDRRKPCSKHPLCTDANGIPLAATLMAANRHAMVACHRRDSSGAWQTWMSETSASARSRRPGLRLANTSSTTASVTH